MRNSANDGAFRLAGWFAAFVLPILLTTQASAQSGRRAPKTLPATNSAQRPADEKNEFPPLVPTLAREVTILVGRQITSKHLLSEDTIYASFVNRLNQFPGITATPIGDVKRDHAVKRARSERESLVVLLQFEVDFYQEGTILINSQDLVVKYSVFTPQTGKEKSKGKVYYQGIGGGRLRKSEWPNGTPIKITTEAAGIEAAEQLHAWLALVIGVRQK